MSHPLAKPIRAFAAGLPGAWEDHPWGESVFKVGKKVFVFFGVGDEGHLTVKLHDHRDEAMAFDWVKPSGYGLDRGGWVSCALPPDAPVEMVVGWIEESYRIVAPKRVAAELDQERSAH